MIASLILAALISSPSIGEIYTLPTWMPRSVDARHTPGSYPATNYPARVTAETWAAYAAIDEAILERAYYLTAGNNIGNIYEPGLDDFDPREIWYGIYTRYDRRAWVVTNLVKSASTRILRPDARVWATNLWGAMGYYGFNGDLRRLSFAFRDADHTSMRYLQSSLYPSSSLIGDVTPAFPAWDWTASTNDIEDVIGQWYDRGVTFDNFAGDTLAPLSGDRYIWPVVMPGMVYDGNTNVFVISDEFTVSGLLSNNFAAVNYLMATNTSTRLLWERAAAASELLAAVDRSYWHDNGGVTVTNSVISATVTKRYEASMDTSGLYLDSDGTVYGYSQHPSLSWQVVSNVVEAVTNSYDYTDLQLAVAPDRLGVTGGQKGVASCGTWRLDVADMLDRVDVLPDYSGDVRFEVVSAAQQSGNPLIVDCDITATTLSTNRPVQTWSFKESAGTGFTPPATLTLVRAGKLQAEWEAPTLPDVPSLRATGALRYPCWRAFTTRRVREVEFASLARFHAADYDGGWHDDGEWRCARTTYADETTGLNWLHGELGVWLDRLNANLAAHGVAETPSVAAATRRLDGAIDEAVARVSLTAAGVIADGGTNLWFDVTYSGGQPVDPPAGFTVGGIELLATVDFVTPPHPTGLITNGVRGVITGQEQFYRVDWDWHALHIDQSE
jgi:hypothetical protein